MPLPIVEFLAIYWDASKIKVRNVKYEDSRNSTVKTLQKYTGPILPEQLWKELEVPNDFEIFRELVFQPLFRC